MRKIEIFEDIADIEEKLNTDISSGLSRKAARERVNDGGRVETSFFVRKRRNFLSCFLGVVKMLPAAILTLVAIAAFFMGRIQLAITVLSTFMSGSIISGMLYLSAQRESERMEGYSNPTVRVLRDGREYITDCRNLVVGDVIILRAGDYITADLCVVGSDGLVVSAIYFDSEVKYREEAVSREFCGSARLFAGSFVKSGYAKAVVCATGEDVCMADHVRAGGLQKKNSDPVSVKRAYKYFSYITTVISAVSFILAVVGIFTAKYVGTLEVFLMYLALMLSLMLISSPIAARILLSSMLKRASKSGRGGDFAIIKNNKAIDMLPKISDVVVLGHSGVTDGQKYISSLHIFGEHIEDIRKIDRSSFIFECIYSYVKAKKTSGTVLGEDSLVLDGLLSAIERAGFDFDAEDVKIRSLYFDGELAGKTVACVETYQSSFRVYIGECTDVISSCGKLRTESGELLPFDDYRSDAEDYIASARLRGEKVYAVICEADGELIVEGLIGICDRVCESFSEITDTLEKKGIKVTLMLGGDPDYNEGYIRDAGFSEERAFVCDGNEPEICDSSCAYSGFSPEQCAGLVMKMKREGRKVAVLGISDEYREAYGAADLVVSYDNINYGSPKYREVELEAELPDGEEFSQRCSQKLRAEADILISRGNHERGGMRGLFEAIKCAESFSYYYFQMLSLFASIGASVVLMTVMSFVSGLPLISYPVILLISVALVFFTVAAFSTFKPRAFIAKKRMDTGALLREATIRSVPSIVASAVCFSLALYLYATGYIMDTAAMPLATTVGVMLTFIVSFLGSMRACIGRRIDIADIKGFAEKGSGKNKLLNIAAMTLVLSSIVRMVLTVIIIRGFAVEYGYIGVCIETLYLILAYVAVYTVCELLIHLVRLVTFKKLHK